jgi:hypothetical protein
MDHEQRTTDSIWALKIDILSARILVWVACVGRDAELTPEAHAYLCDRYHRLALHCRRGHTDAAAKAEAKAGQHWQDDGPPFAAAMAMPRPSRWAKTWAVSGKDDPDDAA